MKVTKYSFHVPSCCILCAVGGSIINLSAHIPFRSPFSSSQMYKNEHNILVLLVRHKQDSALGVEGVQHDKLALVSPPFGRPVGVLVCLSGYAVPQKIQVASLGLCRPVLQ